MNRGSSPAATALASFGACLGLCLLGGCAKQPPIAPPPAPEPHRLQGDWEADGDSGPIQLTIAGDSLWFYARDDFQYEATFTLVPQADPPELHATILDTPRTTDSAGERVIAVYRLVDDVLDLAVVDKSDGTPTSFDQGIGRYLFERVEQR